MAVCVVCRRQEGDIVCEDDRSGIAKMLGALPGRLERLSGLLFPGQGQGLDESRVATSRTDAQLPIRTAALSLLAGGNEQVSGMLHPLVRRWKTRRMALVSRIVVAGGVATIVEEEKEIDDWHREFVRDPDGRLVEAPDDDQIGTLPPREWLDTQVRYWRLKLGDHLPSRTPGAVAHSTRDALGRPIVTMWPAKLPHGNEKTGRAARVAALQVMPLLSSPPGREIYSMLHAVEWWRQQQINRRVGLYREVSPALRPMDPLMEDVEARFGEPPRALAIGWDVKYLLTHLDVACDRGDELAIETFAAELHALTAELLRALGEKPKDIWIGRCPAMIAELGDRENPRKKPCGAGLWQQIEWAQVPCPRCHTTWDTRGPAGRTLAREICRVWPVDRRRRYNAEQLAAVVPPKCPGCNGRVQIEWREVTGTGERQRWWQARASTCGNRCEKARQVL